MEALTYDRALAYKDEFPPNEYQTWQPRKVLSVLLDIDPTADQDVSIAFGVQKEYGVPATNMTSFGSEKVLNMHMLKTHYDALGSYLHVQSMKQMRDGVTIDYYKMRTRCEEIAEFIKEVLSSHVFNVTLGVFASMKCVECENPIRKRIPNGQKEVLATCHHCMASYTVVDEGEGRVTWRPHNHEVECANNDCHEKIFIWERDVEVGRFWKCKSCKGINTFIYAINYEEAPKEVIKRSQKIK